MLGFILLLIVAQVVICDSHTQELACRKYDIRALDFWRNGGEIGYINIRGNSGEYHHVFREINSAGEVWLHFGRQGQVDWNYINSISNLSPIILLQQRHIDAISDFHILDYAIDTDVDFYLQADDSINPSLLKVSRISDPATMFEIKMDRGGNHAHLTFAPGYFDRIRCTGASNSNTCGQLNKPPKDQNTDPIIIWEANFRPTDTDLGATAINSNGVYWHRNKFTWNGTKYIVKIKIEDQK
ncbi:unnamed protein product [Owenia fusiformis]|uniref:Uncharacterized protein n=1 Tax=Owenia fusiformis TaxID=6347 RepID=A0A8S4PRG8_OWEFU|nr:unnamed protein product [Owenia fusiformis]